MFIFLNMRYFILGILCIYCNIVKAQINETFPKEIKCSEIIKPCERDNTKSCTRNLCGSDLDQHNLTLISEESQIYTKKFDSVFQIEDTAKKIFSQKFTKYEIRIITENLYSSEQSGNNKHYDPRRINVIYNTGFRVVKINLG